MKRVSFYFDFSSPFAYLASTQVERVAAQCRATVDYKPFLLGGLFKEIGTPNVPLLAMPEPKRKMVMADIYRWADHWGVAFNYASRFPMNTVKPLRLVLAAPDDKKPALIASIYRAYWVDDRDISSDEVLVQLLDANGLDGQTFVKVSSDEQLRAKLKEVTDEARQRGVCGAPCFLVGDQLFWGQDRLLFVEKALNGWCPRSS